LRDLVFEIRDSMLDVMEGFDEEEFELGHFITGDTSKMSFRSFHWSTGHYPQ
jgi:hypothetical protein